MQKLPKEEYDDFNVLQVKEKYGGLRFYTNWGTEEIYRVLAKYEQISEETCCRCGKPADYISTGWICPYCEECAKIDYDDYLERNGTSQFNEMFRRLDKSWK